MKISDAEISSLLFDEQGSDPATPAAGFWRIYTKAAGLYLIDDGGAVSGPFGSAADLAAHIADATDAHDASAISYAGGTGMSATDVEAAIDELATEKANLTGGTFSGDIIVPDEAYDATAWNGSLEVPTKNAVRDKIETLGAGGGGTVLATRLTPSSDTYINSAATTTNYDTATALVLGSSWGSASSNRRGLMTFDVSTLSGKTIRSAKLRLVTVAYGAAIGACVIHAREMLRAYVANQVTWDVYSTGNNWGTSGARNTTTDVSAALYGGAVPPNNQNDSEIWVDLTQLLNKRIAAGDTTFRFIFGPDATSGDNNVQVASLEHATTAYRPYMDVLYT